MMRQKYPQYEGCTARRRHSDPGNGWSGTCKSDRHKGADKMGEELTLEECFSGLEEIIEKMQDTEVSLEDSFALYEREGMKMLKTAIRKLMQ